MRTIIIISLVLVLPAILLAQQTYVPDDNFEQALIDLGYDTPPLNDSVPTANVDTIRTLNVSSENIKDLKGIEDFTALWELICSGNNLTSLDLSNNVGLKALSCNASKLINLDISNNLALLELNCSGNELASIDVSNNIDLWRLSCYGNNFTSLDLSNNSALEVLYCWYTQLTNIDLSNNPNLTDFRCDNNKLTSLEVSNNADLRILYCVNNNLTSLDLSNNADLEILSCGRNKLTSLDVSNNTSLKELSCWSNNLSSLDVSNNSALLYLNCGENNLSSLDLRNNPALEYLDCTTNNLTSLDLSNNSALEILHCDNNELTSLDIKNGNNKKMRDIWTFICFDARFNPDLVCIQVDDSSISANNDEWWKDITAHYSEDCGYTGIDFQVEDGSDNISILSSPNPFSQSTMIKYQLVMPGKVVLNVYDVFGNEVATLLNEFMDAGEHKAQFNAGNLPQGIYFYKIQIDNATRSGHLLLIK